MSDYLFLLEPVIEFGFLSFDKFLFAFLVLLAVLLGVAQHLAQIDFASLLRENTFGFVQSRVRLVDHFHSLFAHCFQDCGRSWGEEEGEEEGEEVREVSE